MIQVLSDEERKDIAQGRTWGPDAVALELLLLNVIGDAEAAILAKLADRLKDAERWQAFLNTRPASTHSVIVEAIDAAIDAMKEKQ